MQITATRIGSIAEHSTLKALLALPIRASMFALGGHHGRCAIYGAATSVGVRKRLRFVSPHGYMKGKEKFGFRIWCRDPDVGRAELSALAYRRTDKPAYRR
ncbi:MAG TPA: hypothetical protein VIY07_10355, partial [Pseudolabrys sp.]